MRSRTASASGASTPASSFDVGNEEPPLAPRTSANAGRSECSGCGLRALALQPHLCSAGQARPPAEKILRGLKQRADAQQFDVSAELSDQLDADRQAVRIKAAGQTERRMTGHVERHCPGKPTRAHDAEYPAVDFYRAEHVLVDRKRGAGDGWHRENIDPLQQCLNPPEQSRTVKHRLLIVNTADLGGQRQLLHESL